MSMYFIAVEGVRVGKLKAGIIGCGKIAWEKHMPALAHYHDKVDLVAFCNRSLEPAQKAAEQWGAPGCLVCSDYHTLLADKRINLVHVCTANNTHSEIAIAALFAGKHVMCEKPMAHSAKAAQAMLEAEQCTGYKLSVSYNNRFRDDSLAVKKLCQSGVLGEIYIAKAYALRRRGVPTWGSFLSQEAQGGGSLIDIGIHALDLALWFMDNYDVQSVTGCCFQKMKHHYEGNQFGPWDPAKYENEDSALGMIKMKNGACILLETSWALNIPEGKVAVTTLSGPLAGVEQYIDAQTGIHRYAINSVMNGELVTVCPNTPLPADKNEQEKLSCEREMGSWLDSIIENRPPLVAAKESLVGCQIIEAIYLSNKTGKTIEF